MSDKIGILGKNDADSVGTHTVYNVPSGRAARVRIMLRGIAGDASRIAFNVAGMRIGRTDALTDGNYIFSTKENLINITASEPTGDSDGQTVAPAPFDYFLSAGEVLTYTISDEDFQDIDVFAVGAEVRVDG